MRELDVLLTGFVDRHYASVSDEEKAAFRRLLELPDPDLVRYLISGETPPDTELHAVVRRIRSHPGT